PAVAGVINEAARTISITVPYGTDVTGLTPTIVHTGASITPGNGIAQDFTNPVTYTVTAEDGTTRSYTVTVTSLLNPAKSITGFSFTDPAVTGDINEAARTVSITVPYGTDVSSLIPAIVHTGASITPGNEVAQDFTNPIIYTVTAEDGTTRSYTVTLSVLPNPAKSITGFSFTDPAVTGEINEAARTVSITVPYGTDVTGLTPIIVHTGASITPGNGIAQDFTNPVIYTVTAEDGTTRSYTVTVTSLLNPAKSITGFSFTDPAVTGEINEAARTVSITVPYGTDVSSLTPTIVHTGASITPRSGVAQDFTNPVIYTVTAEDGTTRSYTVTVTSLPNPAKSITGFSFTDPAVTGEINEAARTVSITVPYGTDVTSLIPAIVHTGASITPGSGVAQDFTNPIIYTVTAEDGTTRSYTVTVSVLPNPAKSITSFSFTDPAVTGEINEAARTVSITVPYGTDVTSLIPTIVHTGASITPGNGIEQDFTNPVIYTVTAEDGTTRSYTVTVTSLPNPAKSITGFSFTDPAVTGEINEAARTVSITVPYGTDVTSLTPTIVHTGASITPGSGVAQDFNSPVIYTVTAEDGTTRSYTVTVTSLLNPAKSITGFNFANPAVTGEINEAARTISITVPYGTDVTSLIPVIVHTGASITPGNGVAQDFTNPVTYTVTAEDETNKSYTVTVIAEAPKKNADLISLTVNMGTLDSEFSASQTGYIVDVGHDVAAIDVTAILSDINASMNINNEAATSGAARTVALQSAGEQTTITIMVTAEDIEVTKNYTLNVNRANAPDINLTYYIAVADVVGGTANVTVDKTIADEDETVNITITDIETGKQFSSLKVIVTNGSVSTTEVTPQANYTFQMPAENVTVEVTLTTVQITTTATLGGGGGGGGGGGTTGEEFENIELKDVSSTFVGKDMSVIFDFRNENNNIQYIAYESLKNAGTISATIEVLKDRSIFADTLPEGEVYRNINIWVGKTGYATPDNIADPVIGFRITRDWMDNNDIDTDSIVLNRYDGRWNKLTTVQTNSDDTYLYFEASTPGFSPFAITGEPRGENGRLESVADVLNSPVDEIISKSNASMINDTQPDKTLYEISGFACVFILFIVCFLIRKQ
uniref:DUF5018 domain-containing protein n=1 Tax=Methanolobus psychrotolerans TaxID=1874706 RepID=UPI000B9160FF